MLMWIKFANTYSVYLNKKYKFDHQFINTVIKFNKQVGWRVNFSVKLVNIKGKILKMKSFLNSRYGTKIKALESALKYWDMVLKSHFK